MYSNSKDIGIKNEKSKESFEACNDVIWTRKGKPSLADKAAIKFMLELRSSEKYMNLFNNDKVVKKIFWNEIAQEMMAAGFNIGDPSTAWLKLRQKFLNLTKIYQQYKIKNEIKPRKPPEYYQYLQIILKDKQEYCPSPTILLESNEEFQHPEGTIIHITDINDCFQEDSTSNLTNSNNKILSEIKDLCAQSNAIAAEHSNKVQKLLEYQNKILQEQITAQNRHREMIMKLFEQLVSNKQKHNSESN